MPEKAQMENLMVALLSFVLRGMSSSSTFKVQDTYGRSLDMFYFPKRTRVDTPTKRTAKG